MLANTSHQLCQPPGFRGLSARPSSEVPPLTSSNVQRSGAHEQLRAVGSQQISRVKTRAAHEIDIPGSHRRSGLVL